MRSDHGFRRLAAFSDAVVAIAITLLVLPLADSASKSDGESLGQLYRHNDTKLLGFVLSFAVIGSFWWGQHQAFERVKAYNGVLVWAMFGWLFGIVFLPFPTELLSTGTGSSVAVHGLYIGTMLLIAVAALVQEWAIVHWPDLQIDEQQGSATLAPSLILATLMAIALVVACAVPSIGMWALVLLVLARPLEHWAVARRTVPAPPAVPPH
jgi:uncharacterized membrane protein